MLVSVEVKMEGGGRLAALLRHTAYTRIYAACAPYRILERGYQA
jgi:hypothetical protein